MNNEQRKYSSFDWIQLIITASIPIILSIYTIIENNRELTIATRNRIQDLEIAENEQKDKILQECQHRLTKLVENYGIHFENNSVASLISRFTTLSALNRLDSRRKTYLIRFLYESKLIQYRLPNYNVPLSLYSSNLNDLDLTDSIPGRYLLYLSLDGCLLNRAQFYGTTIYGGNFRRSKLNNADFRSTINSLDKDFLFELNLIENFPLGLIFDFADLTGVLFTSASYVNASFDQTLMKNTNFNSFFCDRCHFWSTLIQESSFKDSIIRNSSFIFSRFEFVDFSQSIIEIQADFYQVSFHFVQLNRIKWDNVQFIASTWFKSSLDQSTLTNSSFNRARMNEVSIRSSIFINVTFISANLTLTDWTKTRCERCSFVDADLTGSIFDSTIFIQVDFKNAKMDLKQLINTSFVSYFKS